MAPNLHSAAHVPQPAQAAVLTLAGIFLFLPAVMALYGQTSAHFPRDVQWDSATSDVMGSAVMAPLCIRRIARAAAIELTALNQWVKF